MLGRIKKENLNPAEERDAKRLGIAGPPSVSAGERKGKTARIKL